MTATSPDARPPLRSGWTALLVTVVARVVVTVLASLALCAVVPAAFGAKPTVVMTGSMLPRLVPGDVVFSRPVPSEQLQLGQVLLYDDPDHAGRLRMHRWVDVTADGRLVTKGDANPERDSTPVSRDAVVGVASLRVPFVARPVVWAADRRPVPIALAALGLLAVAAAALWFRPEDEGDAVDGSDDQAAGHPGRGRPVEPVEPVDPVEAGTGQHALARAGVVLAVVAALGVGSAATADAATPFSARTSTPGSSFTSATYFTCGSAARATGARFAWPLGENGPGTAQDVTANDVDGTYSGGITYGVAGPCRSDATTAVTLNGSTGAVASSLPADSIPELTAQVWVKAAPGSRGGTLVSFTDNGLFGLFPSSSFAVGMGTGGGLTFAFLQSGAKLVVSAGADLRDNTWHQVTAVAGTIGMTLYVDGQPVASNQGVPCTTSSVTGTPRIGYGVASSLATSTYSYFTGSVAFASVWKSALPAATVLATYRAAV